MSAWAGQFDCSQCQRKRLIAADFSKKALERHRSGEVLRCKSCVGLAAEQEREARETGTGEVSGETGANVLRASHASVGSGEAEEAVAVAVAEAGQTVVEAAVEAVETVGALDTPLCSTCLFPRALSAFNRAQLNKGPLRRCRACVTSSESAAASLSIAERASNLTAAQERLRRTKGGVGEFAAAMALSNLEAELVTGIKPTVLGRGGDEVL